MVVAAVPELVGRAEEVASLRAFVAAIHEGPRALVLRGDPGIGKTTVWRAGLESGRRRCTVVSARCVEAELPLALVGLSDLVSERFGDLAGDLADHDRAVLEETLGLAAPERTSHNALALPLAFLALLRLLARDEPVLIAVDDVQWLDPSSARILSFTARRLGDLPVGILLAQRGDGPDPLDLRNALGEAYEELPLGPLNLGAITHLVRSRCDVSLPRPVLARVHEASGGNPMFALEFARSLDRNRTQLGPIAIPSSLHDLVRGRVERCPDDVRRVLAIVAAAGRITRSELARVDPAAPELLTAAADLDAVAIEDGDVVRFTHPPARFRGVRRPDAVRKALSARGAGRGLRGRRDPGAAPRTSDGRAGSGRRRAARRSRGPCFGTRGSRVCRRAGGRGTAADPAW